jgi:di/tricarboxylate transporter
MTRIAQFLIKIGGRTEKGILPVVLATGAFISSFMPNVGAAALMLPVVSRVSARTNVPLSRLLMPMGFCVLLGGTLSLVGCSALIVLNDVILAVNQTLPAGVPPLPPFGLFAPTPIGVALVSVGIFYFLVAGHKILPALKTQATESITPVEYFQQRYGVQGNIFELLVTPNSPLMGATIAEYEQQLQHQAAIIALLKGRHLRISPAKDVTLEAGDSFALMGNPADIETFAQQFHLLLRPHIGIFTEMLAATRSGVSEVVIPSGSQVSGQSLLGMRMRKTYGLSVLQVTRQQHTTREGLRDWVLQSGDTLLVHSTWEDLAALKENKNFITVSPRHLTETPVSSQKVWTATTIALITLSLVLFTELRLALVLLMGALGMILSGVIKIEESYKRVSWQTVFLLAGLIPLGTAFQTTGTAVWIAHHTVNLLGGMPMWVLQTVLVLLTTLFSQLMSNVGTTVLLVPIAVNIALQTGGNPAAFALMVALATSNSFLLPTHQVNALVMGPGGYRVADYLRAGGVMTVLFLVILVVMINVVF